MCWHSKKSGCLKGRGFEPQPRHTKRREKMGVAATLFVVQQMKRIEQRGSGGAQWLTGPCTISWAKGVSISNNKIN